MHEEILIIFIIMLIAAMIYSIKFPPLAIPIGIGTFGIKQIVQARLPIFQTYSSIINIVFGISILLCFISAVIQSRKISYVQNESKTPIWLTFLFVSLYWVSYRWSPFIGDIFKMVPYFIVYILILPVLMGTPGETLKAFKLTWAIILIGCSGLLISPYLATGLGGTRMVIVLEGTLGGEGYVFSLADLAILLALISMLFLIREGQNRNFLDILMKILYIYGIIIGLVIGFITSRGELLAGVLCVFVLFLIFKIKNNRQLISIVIPAVSVLMLFLVFLYIKNYDSIIEWSPRFEQIYITEGKDERWHLTQRSIDLALSSPEKILIGIGARGCEAEFGLGNYPHSNLVQAFVEMGLIGFLLLLTCYISVFRLGIRTLQITREKSNMKAMSLTAIFLCLLIYELLMENKRGALHTQDTAMWLILAVFAFDRAKTDVGTVQ